MSQSSTSPVYTGNLALLQRGKPQSSWALMQRLFRNYIRRHLGGFIWASVFMAIAAGMTGLFASTLEQVVNGMVELRGLDYMLEICAAIVVIFFVRGLTTYFHTVIMNRLGQRIITDVQQEMYDHLMKADLAFFHANASGTLMSRLTNDVSIMRYAASECLTNSFKGGLTLAGLIAVMFYKDWQLSCAVFLVFPVSAWFVARMGKRMRRISANTQSVTGDFASLLSQTFQGIRHVKAYGMEAAERTRVQSITETIYKLAVKGYRLSALTSPVMELLSAVAISAVVIYGYWQVAHQYNTPGALVAFITSFILAYDPMKRMAKVNAQLQAGLAAAERVFALLDVQPTIVNRPGARPLDVTDYSVGIEDVVFRYADGTQALDHLTIKVPHGKTAAIVGASGAGKSTIINLIPRFYDVQEGRISIGGFDVRDVTSESLRGQISLVSQETALFDETVRANIAYGRPDASDEDIEAAAVAAFADSFIATLPDGYNTIVGEHGVKLSGGQRQRIAIARAMLRNAPILLLDEATSALDNESERAVQAALKRLQQGRTTIVVAHRLSTIVDADQIVVLERGAVVEQGTHAELLVRQGVYARLYGQQTGLA
ncbi:MAG: ABC transporter ATP-binding protein [Alphaproteobacteria bacterium]|nr:ABC transporter ATP-binding protein [Alphaproteobacteria bacterium]